MTSSRLLAVAALAGLTAFGAHADEFYGGDRAVAFEGARTRAEVQAEAVQAVKNFTLVSSSSVVHTPARSDLARTEVRAQTAQAVRLGQIGYGEAAI